MKLNKLLSTVKSPYISDMKFTVFSLGPYSPSLKNIKILRSEEITKQEIVLDLDAFFKGQMEAELSLKVSYEKFWIKDVPVRVNLKIQEIYSKMRIIISPRINGVTQTFMSFLGKPYITYELVPHFESLNLSFNVKLETEDFSLSAKIIDMIF